MLETSFRKHRDEVARLVVHQRQNGKNKIRSYCYGTAVTAQRQVGTETAQRNFFLRRRRNSYGAYVILTEFTQRQRRNGNGRTATEWWKPGISPFPPFLTMMFKL